jgi:hypothetical protein
MYATVRIYEMTSDWDDDLVSHVETGFLPLVRGVDGFVSYQCFEAGPRLFASVTLCRDVGSAEEVNKVAGRYAQDHLADRFPSSPEITSGEVRAEALPG